MQQMTTSTNATSNRSHLAEPLDALLADLVAEERIPGVSLAVTTSTTLLYAGGSGWADLRRRRPTSADTPYLWFSLTKIATATAAMALADRGRLDLDAPVSDYLPSYPTSRARERGPVMASSSTTRPGSPTRSPSAGSAPPPVTRPTRRRSLPAYSPSTAPASTRSAGSANSNLGYLVLAEVIAAAVGEPFSSTC